jgi:hypothetical protein
MDDKTLGVVGLSNFIAPAKADGVSVPLRNSEAENQSWLLNNPLQKKIAAHSNYKPA